MTVAITGVRTSNASWMEVVVRLGSVQQIQRVNPTLNHKDLI